MCVRACALLSLCLVALPRAFSASGSIDLYLQNSELEPDTERDEQNIVVRAQRFCRPKYTKRHFCKLLLLS